MRNILTFVFTILLMLSVTPVFGSTQNKAKAPEQTKAKTTDEAVAITDDITPPRLSEVASAEYTPEARKKKIEGSVTLMIVVDKKGDVTDAKVVKGLGYGLDENAILAVKEWKYKPAEKDGEPIAVKMEVTVEFYPRD
jgi:TonB family protein